MPFELQSENPPSVHVVMKEVSAEFLDQLRSIRAGEPRAVELFVATYEPFIRRTIRHRLGRAALRSVADSIDVCQSVFGSFLIRNGGWRVRTEI